MPPFGSLLIGCDGASASWSPFVAVTVAERGSAFFGLRAERGDAAVIGSSAELSVIGVGLERVGLRRVEVGAIAEVGRAQ